MSMMVVQLNNIPEFVYLYYACATVGVLPVMALPPHRFAEISYLTGFSGAVAYALPSTFRGFDYRPLARSIEQTVPSVKHFLVLGEVDPSWQGAVSFADLLADPIEERSP